MLVYPRTVAGWIAASRERWRERTSRLAFYIADYERRRRIKRWLLGLIGRGSAPAAAPAGAATSDRVQDASGESSQR